MTPVRHAHVCQEMRPAHMGDVVGRTKGLARLVSITRGCSSRNRMARALLFRLTAGFIVGGEEGGQASTNKKTCQSVLFLNNIPNSFNLDTQILEILRVWTHKDNIEMFKGATQRKKEGGEGSLTSLILVKFLYTTNSDLRMK